MIVLLAVAAPLLVGLGLSGWRSQRTWTSDARARRRLERRP